MTTPILRWPGGKRRMCSRLLPLLPPHTCYVEAFAGGLALLLSKPRSKCEIVNDLNEDLVKLYRCVQWHMDALIAEFEGCLSSRLMLVDFKRQPGLTDIQRAARFLAINRTSFAGNHSTFAVTKSAQPSRQFITAAIRELSLRLDKVAVENLPWQRLLTLYDSPDTLFFFDPPYLHADTGVYKGWTEQQMSEFAAALPALQGKFLLTVDDSPFNRSLFAAWPHLAHSTRNQLRKQTGPATTFGELIIQSHPTETAIAA